MSPSVFHTPSMPGMVKYFSAEYFSLKSVTQAGISWGMSDLEVPTEKKKLIADAEAR